MVPIDLRPLKNLNEIQQNLILEIATALSANVQSYIAPQSDICIPAFAQEFQNRLVLYHAMNEEVLKKKSFEFAFARSSSKAGKKARLENNPVHAGTDAVVDGVSFSLKTEAAKSIRRNHITISKLMEARWIRECYDGNDFLNGVHTRIATHLQQYERIVMLRAFARGSMLFEYHLVEIPVNLLLEVRNLQSDDFSDRTRNGSSTADVFLNGKKAFSLRLDGSVEKVTISGLDVKLCDLHGKWVIPVKRV